MSYRIVKGSLVHNIARVPVGKYLTFRQYLGYPWLIEVVVQAKPLEFFSFLLIYIVAPEDLDCNSNSTN